MRYALHLYTERTRFHEPSYSNIIDLSLREVILLTSAIQKHAPETDLRTFTMHDGKLMENIDTSLYTNEALERMKER